MLLGLTLPKDCDNMRVVHDKFINFALGNAQGLHSELKNCNDGLCHGNGQKDQTCPRKNGEQDDKSEQELAAFFNFHARSVTPQTAASTQN
jgi:hypothetical protein